MSTVTILIILLHTPVQCCTLVTHRQQKHKKTLISYRTEFLLMDVALKFIVKQLLGYDFTFSVQYDLVKTIDCAT
jgi:hypothetical protein